MKSGWRDGSRVGQGKKWISEIWNIMSEKADTENHLFQLICKRRRHVELNKEIIYWCGLSTIFIQYVKNFKML